MPLAPQGQVFISTMYDFDGKLLQQALAMIFSKPEQSVDEYIHHKNS